MTDSFDPYYTWLGVPPDERPIDFYRLLGIPRFEENADVISNAIDQRMAYIRTFQNGKRSKFSQQILNELSKASGCLLVDEKKIRYDDHLKKHIAAAESEENSLIGLEQIRIEVSDLDAGDDLHLEPLQPEFLPSLEDLDESTEAAPADEAPDPSLPLKEDKPVSSSSVEMKSDSKKIMDNPLVLVGIVIVALFFIGVIATASYMFIGGSGKQVKKGPEIEVPPDDPDENDPSENDPSENDPSENDPSENDPSNPDPNENDPNENDPSNPDPGENDPSNPDPSNPDVDDPPTEPRPPTATDGPKLPELPKKFFALQLEEKGRVEVQGSARLAYAAEFTIEMWLRCENKTGTYRCFGTLGRNNESDAGLRVHGWAVDLNVTEESVDVLVLEAVEDQVHRSVTGKFSNDRQWHHLALVSSDNELLCLIDGRIAHRAARQFVVHPEDARDICFGAPPFSRATMSFPGQLRAMHAASAALYTKEFEVLAESPAASTSTIRWDFEKPKLAEVTDLQDEDNSGRLIGARWVRFEEDVVVALGDADLNDLGNPVKTPNDPDPNDPDPNDPDPNDPDPNDPDPNEPSPNEPDPNEPDPNTPAVVEDLRLPIPTAAELKVAADAVAELYRDQIEAAKTTKELAELGQVILVAAGETDDDPVSQFALYQSAADFAARSGRYLLAWKVLDEMAMRFKVSVVEEKAAALERASKRFNVHYEFKLGSKGWIHLVDAAVHEDKYELARSYAAKANGAALRSFDDDFKRYVDFGLKAIKQLMSAYELRRLDHQQTAAELASDDEASHWGRFLCLYKNDWDEGLKLWARGDGLTDPLVDLVQLDVENPTDVKQRIAVADQWWKAHEDATDILPKRFFAQRASYWYRTALSELKGLARATAETRLRKIELSEIMLDRGKAVDLVEVMEPQGKTNGWAKRGSRLGIAQSRSRVHENSKLMADGAYELHVVFNRADGSRPMGISFPVGDEHNLMFKFGDQQKEVAGLETIERKYVGNNGFEKPDLVSNGTQHAIRILVQPNRKLVEGELARVRVKVMWDGRDFVEWEGPLEHLATRSSYGEGVAVFTDSGNTVVFDRIQLLLISGDLQRVTSN
jgi:hypothetical protein